MVMENRIRGFPRGEIEADTEFAGTVEIWRDAPTATHVLLFTGAGSSSGPTTKHTAVVSLMTKSATHLCSDLYAVPLLLNDKGRLRKSFMVLRQHIIFWTPSWGVITRRQPSCFLVSLSSHHRREKKTSNSWQRKSSSQMSSKISRLNPAWSSQMP